MRVYINETGRPQLSGITYNQGSKGLRDINVRMKHKCQSVVCTYTIFPSLCSWRAQRILPSLCALVSFWIQLNIREKLRLKGDVSCLLMVLEGRSPRSGSPISLAPERVEAGNGGAYMEEWPHGELGIRYRMQASVPCHGLFCKATRIQSQGLHPSNLIW